MIYDRPCCVSQYLEGSVGKETLDIGATYLGVLYYFYLIHFVFGK